jgi:hypothetical protein
MSIKIFAGAPALVDNLLFDGFATSVEWMFWLRIESLAMKNEINALLPRLFAPLRPIGVSFAEQRHIPLSWTEPHGAMSAPRERAFVEPVSSTSVRYGQGVSDWEIEVGWIPDATNYDLLGPEWEAPGQLRRLAWLPDDEQIARRWCLAANLNAWARQLDWSSPPQLNKDRVITDRLMTEYTRATLAMDGIVQTGWSMTSGGGYRGVAWFGHRAPLEEAMSRLEAGGFRLRNELILLPRDGRTIDLRTQMSLSVDFL